MAIEAVGVPATFELAVTLARPGGRIAKFITHHFGMDEFPEAYDVFARAADTGALKVALSR